MKNTSTTLTVLRLFAVLTALLAIWQTVVGFGWVDGGGQHGTIGNVTFVVALVAAVAAFLWSRASGNKGLLMHAAGMAVLALVQIGLGEMSLAGVHMAVGVLFLVGAVALATLAIRKPGVALDEQRVDPARLRG
ncbi:hypothetical protein [Ornithinimicrobium cerasi]|uniref:Integral membrane protein n=1 Tax=Ornithinimicrobium cerasi TaxID=2248773 RepID=A0A285VBX0_9MICO|nr:hypothetical protein [Ornithinimicrobium cerasi]SOC51579.1 hypothetical protein SAMN05421879_101241 [Ornithinimicrobium cerasi]